MVVSEQPSPQGSPSHGLPNVQFVVTPCPTTTPATQMTAPSNKTYRISPHLHISRANVNQIPGRRVPPRRLIVKYIRSPRCPARFPWTPLADTRRSPRKSYGGVPTGSASRMGAPCAATTTSGTPATPAVPSRASSASSRRTRSSDRPKTTAA